MFACDNVLPNSYCRLFDFIKLLDANFINDFETKKCNKCLITLIKNHFNFFLFALKESLKKEHREASVYILSI